MSHPQSPSYGVVVPVKPPAIAKSRLAALGDVVRQELCAAFAMDTISAVTECPLVRSVLVVTDDARLAAALVDLGVRVIPDGVADNLNASLELGAAELLRLHPGLRLAAVFADLPALRPDELSAALVAAGDDGLSFVADAQSRGTTMVAAPTLSAFTPRFGVESRQAHLDLGGLELHVDAPGLRQDIDTPDDLAAAVRLGVGARTSFVVTAHSL